MSWTTRTSLGGILGDWVGFRGPEVVEVSLVPARRMQTVQIQVYIELILSALVVVLTAVLFLVLTGFGGCGCVCKT